MTQKARPYSEWTAEQKAKHRETFKHKYQTDPEFREKVKARTRLYAARNRDKLNAGRRAKHDKELNIPKIEDGNCGLNTIEKAPAAVKVPRHYRAKNKDWNPLLSKDVGIVRSKLLRGAKRRALCSGLPFNLTIDDIHIPKICPVLGLSLEVCAGSGGATSPSLDRIVPPLGYTKGNVLVISGEANRLKSNATLDQLKRLVSYVSANTTVD